MHIRGQSKVLPTHSSEPERNANCKMPNPSSAELLQWHILNKLQEFIDAIPMPEFVEERALFTDSTPPVEMCVLMRNLKIKNK